METSRPSLRGPRPAAATAPRNGRHAWLVWLLASVFVVWIFAIQTAYAVI
ncbi:hypothetical protein EDF48_102378 [Curtobacterium sp. PhB191]|nr:hypothetical protein [Curtobacterium sp. PhB191]TCU86710.1 hypothetical protein EDF48_102378 [Curtobacterium sp. PhB191]